MSQPITDETVQIYDDDLVDHLRLSIRLWVECRRHIELDARGKEKLRPEATGEHRIVVVDDAAGDVVEAHNGVEEGVSDRRRGIHVCQRNEMGGLGESVNHGEDHRFAIDPR
jgi:hypothetical protein